MRFVALGLVCLTTSLAQAQTLDIGARAGLSTFVGKELRDLFGTRVSFGFSPFKSSQPKDNSLTPDINIDYANENGSRMLIIPVTMGISHTFGKNSGDTVPYVAARAGAAYLDYRLQRGAGSVAARTVVFAANAELGLIFSKRLRLSARYDWYGKSNSFDFNSVTLAATLQLFRF